MMKACHKPKQTAWRWVRYIYNVLHYLAIPGLLGYLFWRSRRAPAYKKRWLERFAIFNRPESQQQGIWVHAVSVGESLAAMPMVEELLTQYPELPITMTTTTPTGSERVTTLLGGRVFHVYAPYDLPDVVSRFLRRIKPKLFIIMETELWPTLLAKCEQQAIPVLLANARLSASSARGYGRLGGFTRMMLDAITAILAQTQAHAQRFSQLRSCSTGVSVAGNLKFDMPINAGIKQCGHWWREQWGIERQVLVAASTHEGEEKQIISAWRKVLQALPDALLVLVPRHPERFPVVADLCETEGFHYVRRSSQLMPTAETQIFVGDTMGELLAFYAASDVAFVGGSLVPVGGHNVLEPAALGVPIITGPHVQNFLQITKKLQKINAAKQVANAEQLADIVLELLSNKAQRKAMGEKAAAWMQENKGALEKHLKVIRALLGVV